MKRLSLLVLGIVILSYNQIVSAAGVNVFGTIKQIDTRENAFVQIWLNEAVDYGQSCILSDRVALDGKILDNRFMIATVMQAYAMRQKVEIRVEGCTIISKEATHTAPTVIRMSMVP